MHSVEIAFPILAGADPETEDACVDVVVSWYKNGQIEDDTWHTIRDADRVRVIAWIPDTGALDEPNHNLYARESLAALPAAGFGPPIVRVLGVDCRFEGPCTCPARTSLILFTHYLAFGTPVRCGDCFQRVPLYRMPHTHDAEHLNVLQWARDYRACDALQMHCTTGEAFAEAQLIAHDSELSLQGRRIAGALATGAGMPVYYYLLATRGSAHLERERRCPSCGATWLLDSAWHGLFDFRCDRCWLLSNIAFDLSEDEAD